MARIVCARGVQGASVVRVQRALASRGLYGGEVDGDFGRITQGAVLRFQQGEGLPASGAVDEACWTALTASPVPSLEDRCLQLTAAFEGHGFGKILGDWDGAWLTWGIIGFTLRHGELPAIVLEASARSPDAVRRAFGAATAQLLEMMRAPRDQQHAWADAISVAPRRYAVAEPWRSGFAALGEEPAVQELQLRRAHERYWLPALDTARRWGLATELGIALCFDVHVQNGGIGPDAAADLSAMLRATPPGDEAALRELVARAVGGHARPEYQEDVLARKLVIARGDGPVHGAQYHLESWGLDEREAA